MNCLNYLQNNQPIAYKIFKNSLEKQNFFHCYLLSGSLGTPLKDIATFLAKSILCEDKNTTFCCDECSTCRRINSGNYPNLIILDGSLSTIRKIEVNNIIENFSTNSLEKNQKRVYIIHLAENMNEDASNALLKFLEEPPQDVYAILTTENKFKLLPTIRSRSLIINFSHIEQELLIKSSIKNSCDKKIAEILSFFYNDENIIKEKSEDTNVIKIINLVVELLQELKDAKKCRFYLEKNIFPLIKTKEDAYLFYNYLIIFLKESLKFKLGNTTILQSYTNTIKIILESIDNLPNAIFNLVNDRNELNYNLLINLLLLKSVNALFED